MHHNRVIKRLLSSLRLAVSGDAIAAAADKANGVGRGNLIAAASTEGQALQRIQLLPIGSFALRDGRGTFVVEDQAHAAAIVAASLAYATGRDIPIDYDHQMVNAIGPGKLGTAPASGWIKALAVEAGGVFADVEWTAAAAQLLADRAYRYISPVFTFDKATGRVTSIRCAGLVNDNAIVELAAVAASDPDFQQETTVNYAKIAAMLGLPETATEDEILAALGAMVMPKPEMVAAAASLGLAATASVTEIVAAAALAAPDPSKFVPIDAFQATNDRLAVLEGARLQGIISAASASGKLSPALVPWAQAYAAKDEAGFTAWLAGAPVLVAAGSVVVDPLVAAASQHGLTAEELKIATNLGLTAEAYANANKG